MNFCSDCKNKNCPEEMPDPNSMACKHFKGKKVTNGDLIRQMSNEELVAFFITRDASYCVPEKGGCPDDCGECKDHWLRWLNDPAESEVEDEI